VAITSRTADAPHAWEIVGSHQGTVAPSSGPFGTTIDVQDLYFNTPARRKFLKSEQTEYGHCAEVVRRIALARPDVSFSLSHNGRTIDHWNVSEWPSAAPRSSATTSPKRACRSTKAPARCACTATPACRPPPRRAPTASSST
jgi:DNA mismatch repair ATPase MutL